MIVAPRCHKERGTLWGTLPNRFEGVVEKKRDNEEKRGLQSRSIRKKWSGKRTPGGPFLVRIKTFW